MADPDQVPKLSGERPPEPGRQIKSMTFETTLGSGRAVAAPRPAGRVRREADSPFCLALLGDFSGRASRGLVEPLASRRPQRIDLDNFERVFASLGARVSLPVGDPPGASFELPLASLDQFHPDQLLRNVTPLARLTALRQALLDPATAAAAATEVGNLLQSAASGPSPPAPAAASGESDAAALARLLGRAPVDPGSIKKAPASAVDAFIKNLAGSSATPARGPREVAALAALDRELTGQLRAILQHPDFQAVEAAWRGLDFLVRRYGGEEELKIFLVDASAAELAADLTAPVDIGTSGLAHALGGQAWTVLLGDYCFGASAGEIGLLARLGQVAAWLDAPFISGARPGLAGCDSFARQPDPADWQTALSAEVSAAWQALRGSPEAARVALALPRFLLRQPYGKGSDAIETFPFEELAESRPHESYLWGNAALLCGCLLAESFQEAGWAMTPRGGRIDGLPVHHFTAGGEAAMQPQAEAWLTDRAATALRQSGLTPLLSVRNSDAVQVGAPLGLAAPAKLLTLSRGGG